MKIKYNGNFFIGAIKFFDRNKDFGFIASNNCGMPDKKEYTQDFYINSSSFVDGTPLLDEAIVVFQIEKQGGGRLRAVNVRRISNSEDDMRLAASYYGDHEIVSLKNAADYNLFSSSNKYLIGVVASRVINIIENDENRNPNSTLEHFKQFINHYRTQSNGIIDLYIFDSDFETEDKQIWINFFGSLTSLEIITILDEYPSVVKYIDEQDILLKWIDSIDEQSFSIKTLRILQFNLQYVKEPASNKLKEIIDKNALIKAEIIEKRHYSTEWELRNDLLPLILFPIIDIDAIIERNKLNGLLYDFQSKLDDFKASRYNSAKYLIEAYNNLPDDSKTQKLEQVGEAVKETINKLIERQLATEAFSIYDKFDFLASDLRKQLKQNLFALAKDNVIKKIERGVEDDRHLEYLFSAYTILKRHYEQTSYIDVTDKIKETLLQSESIFVLFNLFDYDLISEDAILQRAIDVIKSWDYNQLRKYLDYEEKPFEYKKEFREAIIDKSLEMISSYSLSEPFNGDSKEEYRPSYYSIERENCEFLKSLRDYSNFLKEHPKYKSYIESRTPEEKLLLYRYEVIRELDEKVLQELVNGISLEDAYAKSDRWYYPPALNNEFLKKVLKDSRLNLCDLIGNRIAQMDVTPENIPLIVFLLEIMSINKPENPSYYEERDWNNSFNAGLNRISNNSPNNAKLKTILWARYFQNSASWSELKDLFSSFPPYIQIKAVKKLFQLISQGKLNKTAEELYELLGGKERPLCFPLEITFEYLKVRTNNPLATLDNNIMLRLLDGRDDHNEWIGIRQLLHNCKGRYYVDRKKEEDNSWRDDKYYNGIAWIKEEGREKNIYLVIPRKMCDDRGNIKEQYNNKYFNSIIQLINYNFLPNSFVSYFKNNAEVFKFKYDSPTHIEILNLARSFNIRYSTYRNRIPFECKTEDEQPFCETRMAISLDGWHHLPFYWCASKPCLRPPVRFRLDDEWEYYTILDFMRILKIPVDYVSLEGRVTKFGHYIILNSFMLSFYKFYEHLKCRKCGQLMKPRTSITNFHTRAVNEFMCADKNCSGYGEIVYLNHCFNRRNPRIRCNATIDSRDSRKCPNDQYICPECGGCCSTENFRNRLDNLKINGGDILPGLVYFVENELGHWERQEFYCYNCGKLMINGVCPNCHIRYESN